MPYYSYIMYRLEVDLQIKTTDQHLEMQKNEKNRLLDPVSYVAASVRMGEFTQPSLCPCVDIWPGKEWRECRSLAPS